MGISGRTISGLLIASALLACDSVELTIAVSPGPNGILKVANDDHRTWTDAKLLVEAVESDNSRVVCAEKTIGTWAPGETIEVPDCGRKIRFTLTTGGETARFSFANGRLFRRFGRKEVPVDP